MKSSAAQKMKSNPFHPPQRISSRSDFIPLGISSVSPIWETDLIAAKGRSLFSLSEALLFTFPRRCVIIRLKDAILTF